MRHTGRIKRPKFEVTEEIRSAAALLRAPFSGPVPDRATGYAILIDADTVREAYWHIPGQLISQVSRITLTKEQQAAAYMLAARVAIHVRSVAEAILAIEAATGREAPRILARTSTWERGRQLRRLGLIVTASRRAESTFDGAIFVKRGN